MLLWFLKKNCEYLYITVLFTQGANKEIKFSDNFKLLYSPEKSNKLLYDDSITFCKFSKKAQNNQFSQEPVCNISMIKINILLKHKNIQISNSCCSPNIMQHIYFYYEIMY